MWAIEILGGPGRNRPDLTSSLEISSASRAFGLPSTIRTCDLRLRSFKNELKQLVKQWDQGVGVWCGIHTENLGVGWNGVDIAWHSQAVKWSDI